MTEVVTKESITDWFKGLQNVICKGVKTLDGHSKFHEDKWDRPEGGGGRTRIIRNGDLIEKGGVNFSAVHGSTPSKILEALGLDNADFYATGVSIVLHPKNPWVPIIHMNVRYFEMSDGVWWFGGGIDLTPHIIIKEKAQLFHQYLKNTCDKHSSQYYSKFKDGADKYFYIKHRKETRGIGGIFFDRLNGSGGTTKQELWSFVQDVGNAFVPIYSQTVDGLRNKEWGEKEKAWQMLRRGRYVEFNLVLDKGTKFGLDTEGRTESILMSLPPIAQWEYNHQPEDKQYKQTLDLLKKGINWTAG